MKKLRVLQILGDIKNGGVENIIKNYYLNIDKKNVQFDFIIHKGGLKSYILEIEKYGAKVYEIDSYKNNLFKYIYNIYKIIKTNDYKIVHCNMNSLSFFPLLSAYFAGCKIRILHNHTTDSSVEVIRTIIKRILRPFAKLFANEYFACSRLAANWMYGEERVKNNKITIIRNAVNVETFEFNKYKRKSIRENLNLKNNLVIGHVGRFVSSKNQKFLIEVFYEIQKMHKESILLLIGDGELRDELVKQAKEYGINEKVLFLGNRNDVAELYNAMDIFVLPSFYEGLPLVGVECQVNGLPIVCSNNITKEIMLSDVIKFLDLECSAMKWAKEIIGFYNNIKRNSNLNLDFNDYNIKFEAKKLENIYFKLIEKYYGGKYE